MIQSLYDIRKFVALGHGQPPTPASWGPAKDREKIDMAPPCQDLQSNLIAMAFKTNPTIFRFFVLVSFPP